MSQIQMQKTLLRMLPVEPTVRRPLQMQQLPKQPVPQDRPQENQTPRLQLPKVTMPEKVLYVNASSKAGSAPSIASAKPVQILIYHTQKFDIFFLC